MKKGLHLTIAVALISGLALVLCGSGCDEDGGFWFDDGGGGGKVRSIEQARAIADPIADAWSPEYPDADNIFVVGIYIDEEGLLLPSDAPALNFWMFTYEKENLLYAVTIYYDGTHWEFEGPGDSYWLINDLPSYSDDHVKFLMGIGAAILIDFIGAGDYMYLIEMVGGCDEDPENPTPPQAAIAVFTKDDYGAPWLAQVCLNADTGEVLLWPWE